MTRLTFRLFVTALGILPLFTGELTSVEVGGEEKLDKILSSYERILKNDPSNVRLTYALGSAYYSNENYERARELFAKAVELAPNDVRYQTALGMSLLYLNRFDESRKVLHAVLDKEPENPEVLTALGRLAQENYDFVDAEEYYQKALERDPKNISALTFMGSLRVQQKRYSDAVAIYEKVGSRGPKWVKGELEKAKVGPELDEIHSIAESGETEEAIERYRTLVAYNPQVVEIYLRLGNLYNERRRFDEAVDLYKRGLRVNPEANALRTAIGVTYLKWGNNVEAEKIFIEAIEKNPKEADAYAGLALIAEKNGDTGRAKKLFEKALSIDPYNSTALNWYAELLLKEKQYSEAEALFRKLMEKEGDSDWVEVRLHRAIFGPTLEKIDEFLAKNDYGKAEDEYKRLIQEYPEEEQFYIDYGRLLIDRGRYSEAIELYKKGQTFDPGNSFFQIGLADAYLKKGDESESYTLFQEVLEGDPENVEALAGLGRIYQQEGNYEEAENYYRKALRINKDSITALSYLADLKLEQHKYEEAEKKFSQILQIDPTATWAERERERAEHQPLLEEIAKHKESGNFAAAESLYQQLIEESPLNSTYYLELGRLYEEEKRGDLAFELYLQGLKKMPEDSQLKTALAFSFMNDGDINEATLLFDEVIEKDPNNGEAWAGLGNIEAIKGDDEKARSIFQKVLKINSENVTALVYIGELYKKQGRYREAEVVYKKLKKLLPNEEWVNSTLLDIQLAPILGDIKVLQDTEGLSGEEKRENQQKAAKLLRQLTRKVPGSPEFYHRLGLQYGEMKRFSDAIKAYETGLKIAPDNIPILSSMGFAYIYSNNYEEAKKIFDEILVRSPNYADAWVGIGRVAEENNEMETAEESYEMAVEIDPENITAQSFLGNLKIKLGRYAEAKEAYDKLVALGVSDEWLTDAMERLKFAPELSRIHKLERYGKIEEAAKIYRYIISSTRNNLEFYAAYGNLYVRDQRYPNAIEVFREGLCKYPDSNKLRTALGIAYAHNEEICNAKRVLEAAYAIEPENPEILSGLGRVAALQRRDIQAEEYFEKAIELGPDNVAALSFYADTLMDQRNYDKAYEMYKRLQLLDPDAGWVLAGLKSAKYGSYADSAKLLQDLGEYNEAECRYLNLIGYASDNTDYYLYLADLYTQMEKYDDAEEVLKKGLYVDSEAVYLWRALGYLYLTRKNVMCSRKIFLYLLSRDPNDAHAWAGLGRVQALQGRYCTSERYYSHALCLSPRNETALNYYALGRAEQERFFDAAKAYGRLMKLLPEKKWVKESRKYACRETRPHFHLRGYYHDEREWDRIGKEWVARYQVYGGETWLTSMVNNRLWINSFASQNYYRLTNTEEDYTIYFFHVTRARFDAKWVFSTCHYIDSRLGLSTYGPEREGSFGQKAGIYPEPTFLLNYRKPREKATIGIDSETNLVGRDFDTIEAKMIARYFLYGSYEREVMKNIFTGIEGDYSLYTDFENNKSQFARAWVTWRPEKLLRLLMVRYYFQYRAFDKVIPDYYTYAPELRHHLQFELSRAWKETGYFALGYAHGHISARTRFNQIVVGVPTPTPLRDDLRDYNEYYLNLGFSQGCFSADFKGDYHRETNRYSIWNLELTLRWRF